MGSHEDDIQQKDGNKDCFELHLRNHLNSAHGVEFASTNFIIKFPFVEDDEICVVEIKPGLKPLYTLMTDKNGVKTEQFYLRSGNSSPALKVSEVNSYISERFI